METWKTVLSLNSDYEVSDLGNVRRATATCGTHVGHPIKLSLNRGYPRFAASIKGKRICRTVHRLVAESFIGEIPAGMQINHINGIKHDNRPENLEICTPGHNSRHRTHVLKKQNQPPLRPGEQNGRAKLTDADMPLILQLRAQGMSQQRIADHLGIHQTNISRVLCGKTGFKV